MKTAQKNLLLAIRNQLRTATGSGGAGYGSHECDVEFDAMVVPKTVAHTYVPVTPGDIRPGPRHLTSFGVKDLVYGVNIYVIRRCPEMPKDRLREVFTTALASITAEIDKIVGVLDWSYTILTAANVLIAADAQSGNSTEKFIEPLRVGTIQRPTVADFAKFEGTDRVGGLQALIPFHGARRITTA